MNKKECVAGLVYNLSITATGVQGLPLEVYASQTGTDCSSLVNRITTAVCWKVYADTAQNGTYTIRIPVQSVVAQKKDLNSSSSFYVGKADDCDSAARSVPSGGVGITLSVLIYSGLTTGDASYKDSWDQFGFDLVGPKAPTTVTAGIADHQLHLHWSSVLDSDRSGFNIYCDKEHQDDAGVDGGASVLTTGGASTGGATSTGGANAAGTSAGGASAAGGTTSSSDAGAVDPKCPPNIDLVPGEPPPYKMSPKGSAATITATDGFARGLDNDVPYACAVSVTDVMQNDGPLSVLACETPQKVNDFFSLYRGAQGKAGGGFCSIEHRGRGVGSTITLAALAMLALRTRRWRRVPRAR